MKWDLPSEEELKAFDDRNAMQSNLAGIADALGRQKSIGHYLLGQNPVESQASEFAKAAQANRVNPLEQRTKLAQLQDMRDKLVAAQEDKNPKSAKSLFVKRLYKDRTGKDLDDSVSFADFSAATPIIGKEFEAAYQKEINEQKNRHETSAIATKHRNEMSQIAAKSEAELDQVFAKAGIDRKGLIAQRTNELKAQGMAEPEAKQLASAEAATKLKEALATKEAKPPSDVQMQAANFARRMEHAEAVMDLLDQAGYDPSASQERANLLAGAFGIGEAQDPLAQMYDQALENWTSANLRKESGAAINKADLESEMKKYKIMPGDSPELKEQKRAARKQAMAGMIAQAAQGYQLVPATGVDDIKAKLAERIKANQEKLAKQHPRANSTIATSPQLVAAEKWLADPKNANDPRRAAMEAKVKAMKGQ